MGKTPSCQPLTSFKAQRNLAFTQGRNPAEFCLYKVITQGENTTESHSHREQ